MGADWDMAEGVFEIKLREKRALTEGADELNGSLKRLIADVRFGIRNAAIDRVVMGP